MLKFLKKKKKKIENIILDYFTNRNKITMTFLLIDLRLEPQQIDIEFMSWLNKKNIKFKIIFTKEDKLKVTQKENKAENYIQNTFKKTDIFPEFIISSSKTKKGRNKILKLICSEL